MEMKKLSCAVASCCRSVKKLTAFIRKKKSKPRELNDSGKKAKQFEATAAVCAKR